MAKNPDRVGAVTSEEADDVTDPLPSASENLASSPERANKKKAGKKSPQPLQVNQLIRAGMGGHGRGFSLSLSLFPLTSRTQRISALKNPDANLKARHQTHETR